MRKLINIVYYAISFGLIISCSQKHGVVGNIDGLGDSKIVVQYIPIAKFYEIDEPLKDTLHSINGEFHFDSPVNESVILFMFPLIGEYKRANGSPYRPNSKYIIVLLNPEDKLKITGKLNELYIDYNVKGTEFNEQFSFVRQEYIEKTTEAVLIELKIDSLMSNKGDRELINDLFRKRNKINGIARIKQLDYIRNNLNKELSAFYLTRQPLDTLGKYHKQLKEDVSQGMFKNMLENRLVRIKKYTKVKEAELNIVKGKVAPDFSLKTIDEKDFMLGSIDDKYVVLDFWGSWCPPCIKGFPKMKEYYSKYNNQVEFIGIACNDTEEKWKKTVNKHELSWVQLINNPELEYDVSITYGIQNYPTKVILDKDKKIIEKFIGEGEDFYQFLDELLGG